MPVPPHSARRPTPFPPKAAAGHFSLPVSIVRRSRRDARAMEWRDANQAGARGHRAGTACRNPAFAVFPTSCARQTRRRSILRAACAKWSGMRRHFPTRGTQPSRRWTRASCPGPAGAMHPSGPTRPCKNTRSGKCPRRRGSRCHALRLGPATRTAIGCHLYSRQPERRMTRCGRACTRPHISDAGDAWRRDRALRRGAAPAAGRAGAVHGTAAPPPARE